MRGLWPLGLGLAVWQMVSLGFGVGEFAYDQPPPLLAMLAAAAMVSGWVALGVWTGHHRVRTYVWFATVSWLLVLAMLVLVKFALLAEGGSVGPWHDALIIPILLAGGPLHPLAHFVPLHDPLDRTIVIAGVMLVASLGSYFVARALGKMWTTMAAVVPGILESRAMDIGQLERFIVRAKSVTYVAGGEASSPSRTGSHDLTFNDGLWSYRDSYFGGADFIGQEVVWCGDEPAWAMNYYGWIIEPRAISAAEAGRVIGLALTGLYREGRFLGGYRAEIDQWEYHDVTTGDVTHFEGREHINRPGKPEAYALVYHGGLIRPD